MPSALTSLIALSFFGALPLGFQTTPQADLPATASPEVTTDPVTEVPEAVNRAGIARQAADALAAAETAKGDFTQISPNGQVTTGTFALRRPGRMRFDYDDPTPILIVSDGTTVAQADRELETVDRIPLASTPLGLILDDELDFESEAEVTSVDTADGVTAITMRDRTGEAAGELTLFFAPETYELLSWNALDGNGAVTRVILEDVETNVNIDPRLFRLDDPADEEEER